MGRKSQQLRKLRKQQQAEQSIQLNEASLPACQPTDKPDSFVAARLARVRKQLDLVDSLLEKEKDPQKLDRLASASMRLSEQERFYANRPAPGARKPSAERVVLKPFSPAS